MADFGILANLRTFYYIVDVFGCLHKREGDLIKHLHLLSSPFFKTILSLFFYRYFCNRSQCHWCRWCHIWEQCQTRVQHPARAALLLCGAWDRWVLQTFCWKHILYWHTTTMYAWGYLTKWGRDVTFYVECLKHKDHTLLHLVNTSSYN